MASVLPERPDLDQLRRQAKELRDAAARGDAKALARICKHSPRVTLAAAQLTIARKYGFASWPRLNLEVRRKQLIARGDTTALRRLFAQHPELAREQVSSKLSGRMSSPLGYVAIARFHGSLDRDCAGALAGALIDAGAPVNLPADSGESPLITAASYGELAMVQTLINAGADLETTGDTVPGGTALSHAVEYGCPQVVDLLVASGARVHNVVEAAGVGHIPPAMLHHSSQQERSRALRAAAICQRLDVIDQLLATGTDVNADIDGDTALHWAAWHAKVASIRHLIDRGAVQTRRDRTHDMTPLGWYHYRRDQLAAVNNPGAYTDAPEIEKLLRASPTV